jgi:TetR/AcrR family transcriptional repressor of nem operon
MPGRPKEFEENVAIRKAANLFWSKGYMATSTDDLIRVMGIQKGSLYNTFRSKKDLFIRAINLHEQCLLSEFKEMLKGSKRPVETIKSVFLSMAEHKDDIEKGCFAGNTLAELSGLDEELTQNAKTHLKELESILFDAIVAARTKGQLKSKVDSRVLASYLLNMWNGLNITRRIYGDKKTLLPLIKLQLEVLV